MKKRNNSELNRLSIEEFKLAEKIPLIVILEDVRSLNNVGSVFRTSDAFRIKKIYLCGITACPPHREIQKTAIGATQSVDWEYRKDTLSLIKELKNEGIFVFSVEQAYGAKSLKNLDWKDYRECAVIFGNEINGISQDALNESDTTLEIEQIGYKHSLNISVCAGIVLWEFFKKFDAAVGAKSILLDKSSS